MAAAHRGAKAAGAATLAILPGETHADANPWADHVVVTGIGHARNLAVAASGDAVIAVGGGFGTLAEIAFALRLGRPVVCLAGARKADGPLTAATPTEAVETALREVRARPQRNASPSASSTSAAARSPDSSAPSR